MGEREIREGEGDGGRFVRERSEVSRPPLRNSWGRGKFVGEGEIRGGEGNSWGRRRRRAPTEREIRDTSLRSRTNLPLRRALPRPPPRRIFTDYHHVIASANRAFLTESKGRRPAERQRVGALTLTERERVGAVTESQRVGALPSVKGSAP